ncbi:MAG: glycosyltransferase [Hydrogenoanaerobacterium sp.]
MRVALFTETYLPQINGVVTHVKILKEGLEKLGNQVLVVTADYDARRHYVKDGVLHCPAKRLRRIYNNGIAPPISEKRLKFIKDFNPDIIHIHNEFGIGLSGIMAAKRLRRPLVYTLHTMYDEYIYYIAPPRLVGFVTKFSHRYVKMLAKNASALTGPSEKCAVYFKDAGVDKKVNVIPNSVELESFKPENITEEKKKAFRAKYGIPDNQMLACFVGRLGREKSVDVVLDYWAKGINPEDKIHLIIIGDGPCKEELEKQAKALGIADMVTFTGAVQHNELPPYLASCDIYITASLSDTNSISMLEGMATGLPVLQRLDPLNADQVRDGENGFVFDSAESMAEKLRSLKNKKPEDLDILKRSVIDSVKRSGAEDLANYMINIYRGLYNEDGTPILDKKIHFLTPSQLIKKLQDLNIHR